MQKRRMIVGVLGLVLCFTLALGWIVTKGANAVAQGKGPGAPGVDDTEEERGAVVQGAAAVGTSITYQGSLEDNGAPAEGSYDLRFELYDSASDGTLVGSAVVHNDVPVAGGVFAVELDFGANAFTGAERWLEIGVRTGGSSGAYTTLSPRQPLTPSPYAVYAAQVASHSHLGETWTDSNYPLVITGTFGPPHYGALILANSYCPTPQTCADTLRVLSSGNDGLEVVSAGRNGVHIISAGNNGIEIWDTTFDGVQVNNAGRDGVRSVANANGVSANTSDLSQEWGVHTYDKTYAGAGYTGAGPIAFVAQNGDTEELEPGDVVTGIGLGAFFADGPDRVPLVGLADGGSSSGVIGVVLNRFVAREELEKIGTYDGVGRRTRIRTHSTGGSIAPGEHLLIVALGVVQVKTDPAADIQPGQRLTASDLKGHARGLHTRTLDGMVVIEGSSVIGVALAAPTTESNTIPVFVTLR